MKQFFFTALVILFVLAQCKKDSPDGITVTPEPVDTVPPAPPVFKDTLAVWKNGVKWAGTVDAFLHPVNQGIEKRFVLRAVKKLTSVVTERFYISDIPCKKGTYTVDDGRSLATLNNSIPQPLFVYVIDEDQGGGSFYADLQNAGNFVTILQYDTLKQIIEGQFNLSLNIDKEAGNLPGIPDTLSMTSGYFKVKLKQ